MLTADPTIPDVLEVDNIVKETSDTFTLEMQLYGSTKNPFEPGQFNMLYLMGVGEVPISISGNPAVADKIIHTTRAVGLVTKTMNSLRKGDCIGVRGPYGTSWPVRTAYSCDIILVAGGIGLAPLRPVMYAIMSQRERYGNVILLYGARTAEDILFLDELQEWRGKFDLEVHVTVDRASGPWRGNVGVVTSLIPKAPIDPDNTVAMVCGPEIMMRFSVAELKKRGIPDELIYVSLERNMKCGVGLCGHCQLGPHFVCKEGPVFAWPEVRDLLEIREI